MKTRALLIVAVLALMPAISNAQLGGLIKKGTSKVLGSVGKAATKEANREIDSAAQKQTDKMVNNAAEDMQDNNQANQDESQGNRSGKGMGLGGLLGGKVDLKYNEEYKFDSRMVMQMELYDKKEVTKMDYYIYISTSLPNGAFETKNITSAEGEDVPVSSIMIMDGENKCFLALTDMNSMKMGIISAVPDEGASDNQTDAKTGEPVKPATITKTGNTRVIAGYKCDEYLVKEQDTREYSKMWFTKENIFNMDPRVWSKAGVTTAYSYKDFQGGMIMAFESYDEDGKMSAKSEVKEINKNFPHTASTKGYSLRQMNSDQGQEKKK